MPSVPSRSHYDPVLDAYLHTGANATQVVVDLLHEVPPGSVDLALDTETRGKDRMFDVNCVTAAWEHRGQVHSVLLNPTRDPSDRPAMETLIELASSLILHNAPFDVPALLHYGLIDKDDIAKVIDTLVLARMALPGVIVAKDLSTLTVKYLGLDEMAGGMEKAFKAAGYKTIALGYERMDIGSPIYRQGAMADTIATLRLEPVLRAMCRDRLTNHPFRHYGATTITAADELIGTQESVHRIMLRRGAVGLAVNREHLFSYAEQVDIERQQAENALSAVGLVGGRSKGVKIVGYLDGIGELPQPWPRTPKGALQATKELLEDLDHPLARAQRTMTDVEMVSGWIAQVDHQAETTGRCHPQCGTLGASATGRMSYSSPPLQQFSGAARPIITSDNPDAAANYEQIETDGGKPKRLCRGPGRQLWSIDWSQIEPVTMGLMAGDAEFLAPYERGEDLYGPLMRAAGIDRDLSKINLLATMYGRGIASLARSIKTSEDRAAQIRRQILSAMPASARWMVKVQGIAEDHGCVITAGGRVLAVDKLGTFRAVNYCIQGSAYDLLANTIIEMERAGLGDTIMIGLHDEVAVDATEEQAREIEQIMLTPPEFLKNWAGRTPVLRTDCAPMGASWQKV